MNSRSPSVESISCAENHRNPWDLDGFIFLWRGRALLKADKACGFFAFGRTCGEEGTI
jgi:hypothetical protein